VEIFSQRHEEIKGKRYHGKIPAVNTGTSLLGQGGTMKMDNLEKTDAHHALINNQSLQAFNCQT
jgi:hypothetical protein